MKIVLVAFLSAISAAAALPPFPTPLWAASLGTGAVASIADTSVSIDAAGDAYVTGFFHGTLSFGATNIFSMGSSDLFVAKYSAAGTPLWIRGIANSNVNSGIQTAMSSKGVFLITDTVITDTFDSIPIATNSSVLVIHYTDAGTPSLIQQLIGNDGIGAGAISVDAATNIYISGGFTGVVSVAGTNILQSGSERRHAYVAKLALDGSIAWIRQIACDGEDRRTGLGASGLASDSHGNTYVAGNFIGTLDFGSTNVASRYASQRDTFIASYDAVGSFRWALRHGVVAGPYPAVVRAGLQEGAVVAGTFSGPTEFPIGWVTNYSSGDIFLAGYTVTGSPRSCAHIGCNSLPNIHPLAVDRAANTYVTGLFDTVAQFGDLIVTNAGLPHNFLAQYDVNGGLKRVHELPGVVFALATDAAANVVLVADMGTNGGTTIMKLPTSSVTLDVARHDASLALSWSALAEGFRVESSDQLVSGWSAVTNAPDVIGERKSMALPATNQTKFFRLVRP